MLIAATPTPSLPRPKSVRKGFKSESGLTIAEVMVASCVLVFALCSSFLVLQRGYQAIDTARNSTIAAQIMQSEIERIRLLDWGSVQSLAGTSTLSVATVFSTNTKVTNRFTNFQRTVTIDTVRNVADIQLTVGWTGFDGVNHSRAFNARYCKNGLYDFYYTRARS